MKLAEPTNLYRKSGMWGTRELGKVESSRMRAKGWHADRQADKIDSARIRAAGRLTASPMTSTDPTASVTPKPNAGPG